ncbi:MAG: FG-GAP-like repeat-containing protein [Terriglobia bacterium]
MNSINRCIVHTVFVCVVLSLAGFKAQAQTYVFGTASYPAPGTGPMITADFNGDGIPDVAVLGSPDLAGKAVVSVFLGRPDGTFAPRLDSAINLGAGSNPPMVAGDFNGDGKLDLITFGWFGSSSSLALLVGNGDGTFQPAVPISANLGQAYLGTMIAADFNSDGKLDLAFSGGAWNSANVTVLPGNGDGTFQNPVTYSTLVGSFIAAGDFNGDGKPDIVVAGEWSDGQQTQLQILLNNGDGTFASPVTYTISGIVQALAEADLTGNHKLDLVVPCGGYSSSVSVLLGNGDGTFGTPIVYSTKQLPTYSTSVALADFNGDGKLDLALTDATGVVENAVTILMGNGDGTFQSPAEVYGAGLGPSGIVAIDVNGDGKPDLAVAGGYASYSSVAVLINRGDGTFPNPVDYSVLQYPYSAVAGDFNGDGKPDIAITNDTSTGGVSVLLGKGDGTFQPHVDSPTGQPPSGQNPTAMAAGDFNGDGKLDLVIGDFARGSQGNTYPVLSTLIGNGDGTFQDKISQSLSNFAQSLAVGDFNRDGKLDVAAVGINTNTVSIFLGMGDGHFAAPLQFSTGPMFLSPPNHNVLVGDFNGDGKLDLAVATDNGIAILLGNGDGTFQPFSLVPSLLPYDPGDELLALADFNGDGKLDILRATQTNIISVALGNGDGTFQDAGGYQLPSILNIGAAVVRDFNGDGKLDVAFAGQSTVMTILFGNGDGTFSRHAEYASQWVGSLNFMAAADFNGDGAPDIGLADFGNSEVSVFINSPVAAFAPRGLTFANQEIGTTSSEQTVTLTNPGSAPLAITDITASGDFAQSNDCGSSLGIGKNCTVNVTFTPTTSGPLTGALTFTDDASVVPQTLILSGTGTGAHAVVSPTSLAFGDQIMYTTSPAQTVTLTNSGVMTLTIASIAASDQFGQTNNCNGSLAPQASCAISVTFTPTETGEISGTLTLTDNSDYNPQTVTLQGTGKGPVVVLSTASLDFGTQVVNTTSAAQTVTITNTGVLALSITSIVASRDFAQTNNCGSSVAIGGSCTISVTFTPSSTGTRSGSVKITDNAGGSPQSVALTGTGVAPTFSASVASLSFGNQFVGTTSTSQTVTVTNTGTAMLVIGSVAIGGANASEFSLATNSCSGASIAPAATCAVSVTFTPSAAAPASASLVFTDNADGSPQSVALSGAGIANAVPLINQPLVPTAALPGGPDFTLTVNGTGFVSGANVKWNGAALATTLVSSSQLTAAVPASDIATAGTASVSVLNGGPGGAASNVVFFPVTTPVTSPLFVNANGSPIATGYDPYAFAVGDFNGDGKLDLAVTSGLNSVAILLGNGDGTFTAAPSVATGDGPRYLAVGDFNGDGKLDLVVANGMAYNLTILLGNGDGTFNAAPPSPATGNTPTALAVGDFNGDGRLDLAVVSASDIQATILLGNGDGTFTYAPSPYVGMYPMSIVAGDFNGDGKIDLAVANAGSNNITILLGNGDGTFTAAASPPATGRTPDGLAVGDFNGDGKLDLAVANASDNNVTILLGNGDGTFTAAAPSPPTGSGPNFLAAADMNGDGVLDLVAVNGTSGNMTILLGKGDGTFTPAASTTPPEGAFLYSAAIGDFDGDGHLDLAAATGLNATSILLQLTKAALLPSSLNFGSQIAGTSGPPQTATLTNGQSTPLNISSISISGDFSQTNNCPSQLAASANCTITVTFLPTQVGTRTGTLTVTDDANGVPGSIQTVALTGTGVASPVVTLSPTSLTFPAQFVNTSSAPQPVTLSNPGVVALAISSIAISGTNAGEFSQTNTCGTSVAGGGSCTISVTFTPTAAGPRSRTASMSITDNASGSPQTIPLSGTARSNPVPLVNQPLTPDAAAVGGAGFTLTVNGTGFVSGATVDWNGAPLATTFVSGSQLTAAVPASDITVARTASITAVNPSPGGGASNVVFLPITVATTSLTFAMAPGSPMSAEATPLSVAVGDLNGDGKMDVVVVDRDGYNNLSSNVRILLGNGDGSFTPAPGSPIGGFSSACALALGDFNGDGKLDLAVVDYGGSNVTIQLGNGDGTFTQAPGSPVTTGHNSHSIAIGDFDGDGRLDIAVGNDLSVTVLLGNGDGTFTQAIGSPILLYSSTDFVAVGDLNGDGKPDLVVLDAADDKLMILLGNGDGTFTLSGQSPATGLAPVQVVLGDFNGDGKLDLAVAGRQSVGVFLGNGDGTFQTRVDYASGSSPQALAVGDFNGDGKLDIVTANFMGNSVSVLLGNGDGTFQSHVDFGTGRTPDWVAVGDFNGDGSLDLVTANDYDNTASVLLQIPVAQAAPSSVTFDPQMVGTTSAAQTVTLTNSGSAPLSISSIVASGDFAQTNTCGASVAAGANCTVTVTFTPSAGGTCTGTITIADNAAGSPQTVNLTGTGEDFTIAPPSGSSTSATVTPGQTATYTLSIAPLGGLSGTVSLTCTGAPSEATCTVSPGSAPMSNAATNVTVSVATTAPSSAVPAHRAPQPPAPFRAPLTWLAMALFLVSAAQWLAACRRGGHCARPALGLPPGAPLGALRLFIVLCAVVLASMWTLACGGGGSGSSGPPPNPGTPAGTYTLTVTATFTSGSTTLKHNIALTLTVT